MPQRRSLIHNPKTNQYEVPEDYSLSNLKELSKKLETEGYENCSPLGRNMEYWRDQFNPSEDFVNENLDVDLTGQFWKHVTKPVELIYKSLGILGSTAFDHKRDLERRSQFEGDLKAEIRLYREEVPVGAGTEPQGTITLVDSGNSGELIVNSQDEKLSEIVETHLDNV